MPLQPRIDRSVNVFASTAPVSATSAVPMHFQCPRGGRDFPFRASFAFSKSGGTSRSALTSVPRSHSKLSLSEFREKVCILSFLFVGAGLKILWDFLFL
jgi:hypothetical protein